MRRRHYGVTIGIVPVTHNYWNTGASISSGLQTRAHTTEVPANSERVTPKRGSNLPRLSSHRGLSFKDLTGIFHVAHAQRSPEPHCHSSSLVSANKAKDEPSTHCLRLQVPRAKHPRGGSKIQQRSGSRNVTTNNMRNLRIKTLGNNAQIFFPASSSTPAVACYLVPRRSSP